ncbi:hypothetical protein AOQ71_31970 [Bradyrhizobium manausense]|uniref:Uncharacterized protein n=1 Tax=Bradyrhizobium manausense TaxID=989370 RepID=A0A0R3D9W3_9BRAD|nr:hypothetical protein AOQ71_31970 [Bradyrhizobium manausense]
MRSAIRRRLIAIERQRKDNRRRVHILKVASQDDGSRQIAVMLASGAAEADDGFLCLSGQQLTIATDVRV